MKEPYELILDSIRSVLTSNKDFIPLHEPTFNGNESKYVQECISTTFVSSVGKFVDRFEKELAEYTGSKYAVALVNGTEALHISLLMSDVKEGDEVLIPPLTFIATANAVHYCGAIPHFVDIEKETLGIDPVALRNYLNIITEQRSGFCWNRQTGARIRAMIPVHVFGHPCNLEGLLSVAKDFNLIMVEDAAESLGSFYHEKHTGTFGLLGSLSFNGNKTITTGGGGAILTDDILLAKRIKHLTTTAKLPHPWAYEHDEIGFNYRMPNINAALGCAQLERLPELLKSKRNLFFKYQAKFKEIPQVRLLEEPKGCISNYWLQTLLIEESSANQRDRLLNFANKSGLMIRPVWELINNLKPYLSCPSASLKVSKLLKSLIVNIPSSSNLG